MVIRGYVQTEILCIQVLGRIPVELKPRQVISFILALQLNLLDCTVSYNSALDAVVRVRALNHATPQLYPYYTFVLWPFMRTG